MLVARLHFYIAFLYTVQDRWVGYLIILWIFCKFVINFRIFLWKIDDVNVMYPDSSVLFYSFYHLKGALPFHISWQIIHAHQDVMETLKLQPMDYCL